MRIANPFVLGCVAAACGAADPPPDGGAVHPAEHPGYDWVVHTGDGYRLHYPESLGAPVPLAHFDRLLKEARGRALDLMGELDTAPPVPVFLVPSREDVKALSGIEANGATMARYGAIVMVFSSTPNVLAIRHETMHALTTALWPGYGNDAWVREGLGVMAGGECSGYTPRAAAAYALEAGMLPTLEALTSSFWELDEMTSHFAAASFTTFARERFGPAALRALWVGGLPELASETERAAEALEADWREYLLEPTSEPRLTDWSVVAGGCRWSPPRVWMGSAP